MKFSSFVVSRTICIPSYGRGPSLIKLHWFYARYVGLLLIVMHPHAY